jgi:hypothetical protein
MIASLHGTCNDAGAFQGRHDVCAPARHIVRANHAGEFIHRYSPVWTPRRVCSSATHRTGESCRRIYAPRFALIARHDICAPARHIVRANHAGEFMRRYSPLSHATTYVRRRNTTYGRIMPANLCAAIRPYRTPRHMCAGTTHRTGESCQRIHSPRFALIARHDICAPARHIVRANHASEFIRRDSPLSHATTYVRRHDTSYGRIMPANSFAAIRPYRTPRHMCAGTTHRTGESCRRIHSPLFALIALIACTAAACCGSQLPAAALSCLLRLSAARNPLQQFCHHAVQYRRCWQLHRITTP